MALLPKEFMGTLAKLWQRGLAHIIKDFPKK